jgi:hypothetical protein
MKNNHPVLVTKAMPEIKLSKQMEMASSQSAKTIA